MAYNSSWQSKLSDLLHTNVSNKSLRVCQPTLHYHHLRSSCVFLNWRCMLPVGLRQI